MISNTTKKAGQSNQRRHLKFQFSKCKFIAAINPELESFYLNFIILFIS